ncbi:MAG: hypothetical protein FWC28_01760, partial [Proteobacteria bacterium]|nr:hypothetical protein [Pseudomonadota bacterium]
RNFLGEQKVPRRRQNARRARKRGPQAQREQRPEGKNMPGRMAHKDISQLRKARAAGPEENNAWRAKEAGPQAQEKTPPGGRRETFQIVPQGLMILFAKRSHNGST